MSVQSFVSPKIIFTKLSRLGGFFQRLNYKKTLSLLQIVLLITLILPIPTTQAFISNGANAIDVLGQYDDIINPNPQPYYNKGQANDGPNALSFSGYASLIDNVNHRYFLAAEGRVLVYNLNVDNTFPDRYVDFVLGKADPLDHARTSGQAGLGVPQALAYDSAGQRLFVADTANHRVLVFDVSTITNGENAVNVLGQANFSTVASANTQAGMNAPIGLAYDDAGQRLFVAQQSNHRVTVFDVAAITDGENAINVLGQTNFTNTTPAVSAGRLNSPRGIAYHASTQRLYVAQQSAYRITIFDVAAIANGENAINVLGQSNFTNSTSLLVTQAGLYIPQGIAINGNFLYVNQQGSCRVSIFDITAVSNNENAINVLGQPDFTTANCSAGPDQDTTDALFLGITYDSINNLLYVNDSNNNRTLAFDVNAVTDGEPAADVFGQYDLSENPIYTKGGPNNGPNIWGFYGPSDVEIDYNNDRLFVVDSFNHRVLVYNLNPDHTFPDKEPDFVLGQPDFLSSSSALTQTGLNFPSDLVYDHNNDRLFVTEFEGPRVMVFDVATITNGEAAINVIGQPNFTSNTVALTASGMCNPWGITYDHGGDRLFVSDWCYDRVLVYDGTAISDGVAAINVLGKSDFVTSFEAGSQTSLTGPAGIDYAEDTDLLFVADWNYNRVIIFNAATVTDGEPAINVLGQTNFTNFSPAVSSVRMDLPTGISYDQAAKRLFVVDSDNSRVMVFDINSITNAEPAINVLGQTNFTNNADATTQSSLGREVSGLVYDSLTQNLYVADGSGAIQGANGNNRVMIFDAAPLPEIVITQTDGFTQVTEGGATDTFDIVLNLMPDTDVVLDIVSDNPLAAAVSLATVTFTNGNWDTPQTITVNAPEDSNYENEIATITVSVDDASSDDDWDSVLDELFNVFVNDNEVASFTIDVSSNPLQINEGDTDSFSVVLDSEPESVVTFDVYMDDPSIADVSVATLIFTDANWDTPQFVDVEAFQDPDYDDGFTFVTVVVNSGDSDPGWDSAGEQYVDIEVIDDDLQAIVITNNTIPGTLPEGASAIFDVQLSAIPFTDVVLDISSDDPAALDVSPIQLTFTNADWDIPQTVTVESLDDANIISENVIITIAVNAAASDDDWDAITSETVNVSIGDDDVPPPAPPSGGGGAGGSFGKPSGSGVGGIGTNCTTTTCISNSPQPTSPGEPTTPENPTDPQDPQEPQQPTDPEQPPVNPESPVQPEAPTQPTEPIVPPTQTPTQPVIPGQTPTLPTEPGQITDPNSGELPEDLTGEQTIFITEINPLDPSLSGSGIYGRESNRTERQLAFTCNYSEFSGQFGISISQSSDADGDGLSDQLECLAQTDPTNSDTDGDGLSDAYEELTLGTNPRQSDGQPGAGLLIITTPEDNMLTGDETPLVKGVNTSQGDVEIYIFDRSDFEEISQQIIAELEADETLNDAQKAELYKNRFTQSVQDILSKYLNNSLDPENPAEAKFLNRIQLLGEASTGNNSIFLLDSEKSLIDNTYLAIAHVQNIFSKEIEFKVDSSLKVLNPDVSTLGNKPVPIEALLGELKIEIDPGNFRPVLAGNIKEPSKVVANWQSDVVSSALIADSLDEEFRLSAPSDLEPGEHVVYVTAYRRSDGAQSETLKIPFTVSADGAITFASDNNAWMYWTAGGSLLIILLAAFIISRKKREPISAKK